MSNSMSDAIALIQTLFTNPPIPYNPANQTLKVWAMFCLRDRGFLVETGSPKADFTVKTRSESIAFSVMEGSGEDLDDSIAWIVVGEGDRSKAQVIPANSRP
jgi:hypothetical protein